MGWTRTAYGDQGGPGHGSGGGEIAEGSGEGFPTRELRWSGGTEMNPFDHGVRFENQVVFSA